MVAIRPISRRWLILPKDFSCFYMQPNFKRRTRARGHGSDRNDRQDSVRDRSRSRGKLKPRLGGQWGPGDKPRPSIARSPTNAKPSSGSWQSESWKMTIWIKNMRHIFDRTILKVTFRQLTQRGNHSRFICNFLRSLLVPLHRTSSEDISAIVG